MPRPGRSANTYAVQVAGKLTRREAEALALDLKELARRHDLKVVAVTTKRRPPEDD